MLKDVLYARINIGTTYFEAGPVRGLVRSIEWKISMKECFKSNVTLNLKFNFYTNEGHLYIWNLSKELCLSR